jgi:hypothetical protein
MSLARAIAGFTMMLGIAIAAITDVSASLLLLIGHDPHGVDLARIALARIAAAASVLASSAWCISYPVPTKR